MDERPVTKRPKWIRLFDHDGNLGRVLLCQPAILLPCKSSEGPSVSFLLFSPSFLSLRLRLMQPLLSLAARLLNQ